MIASADRPCWVRSLIALACLPILASCAPSDPVGTDTGTRKVGSDYQVAIALCDDEVVSRITLYRMNGDGPKREDTIWEVRDPDNAHTDKQVFTIGSSDGFRERPVPFTGKLPPELLLDFKTSVRSHGVLISRKEFRATEKNLWDTGHGLSTLRDMEPTLCDQ